jgi:hypothetical protein
VARYVIRDRGGFYLSGIWTRDPRAENALIFLTAEQARSYLGQSGYRPGWVADCEVFELRDDGTTVPVV